VEELETLGAACHETGDQPSCLRETILDEMITVKTGTRKARCGELWLADQIGVRPPQALVGVLSGVLRGALSHAEAV
jgi:hypothetical protein